MKEDDVIIGSGINLDNLFSKGHQIDDETLTIE